MGYRWFFIIIEKLMCIHMGVGMLMCIESAHESVIRINHYYEKFSEFGISVFANYMAYHSVHSWSV